MRRGGMTDNLRGAFFMMGSMAAFTANDACVKWLADGLPAFQVVLLRSALATLLLLGLARATGAWGKTIPRADRPFVAARTAAEVAAFAPFILALTHMPLAEVTAILQALPLTITAAGAILLGERVGWRRWTAIGVGLLGVLLIVRPGTSAFSPWSLSALLAVLVITARDIATRRLSPAVPSLKVAVFTAAGVTALGGALSLREPFAAVSVAEAGVLVLAALAILCAYLLSILAMRAGEVAVVTPFRYSAMVWGLLLGAVVFGERPDGITLVGAALVVGTGLYTLWRETHPAPAPRPVAPH